MKNEELKALELSDEQIKAVQKIHGLDIESQKTKIAELTASNKTLAAQIAKANETIEGFEGIDAEKLNGEIADWKAKFEQSEADAKAAIAKVKYDAALEKTLKEDYNVKDASDIVPHLNHDEINLTDNGFVGLKEQLEPLQKSKEYLFISEEKAQPQFADKSNNPKKTTSDAAVIAMRKAAGLSKD